MKLLSLAVTLSLPAVALAGDAVFGIQLGEVLQSQECAFRVISEKKAYNYPQIDNCFEEPAKINGYAIPVRRYIFGERQAPAIVLFSNLILLEIDGRVEGIRFGTAGVAAQEPVMLALKQKYGEPTSIINSTVHTAAGAPIPRILAEWATPSLSIMFTSVTTASDRGEVFIDHPAATALRRSWRDADSAKQTPL